VHVVDTDALRTFFEEQASLGDMLRPIGRTPMDPGYLEDTLGLPLHLEFAIRETSKEDAEATLQDFASIPFFSLCKGLLLPLSGLHPERVAALFAFQTPPPPRASEREELLKTFIDKDVGLSLVQKLCCVLGDPFRGKPGTFRRDSLVRLLLSVELKTRRQLLDRLTIVGDVAVLFAESRPTLRCEPALTAAEVLESLRFISGRHPRTKKFDVLRSLLARCGKLEAYFLSKLILRKAGFGFDYQGALIARVLAEHFDAQPEQVAHAMALTEPFHVVDLLAREGAAGLRSIRLQPLVPVRPALASGGTETLSQFPVWVERKYDGIRFMLHKSTDARGSVLVGAYTRNRRDWLELVRGLDASIRAVPAHTVILDGELYGTVVDLDGARPATVYEVHGSLQGERARPVNLKFAAFDLLYLNGQDLTQLPLTERRRTLQALLAPLANYPLPVPMVLTEGQLANNANDVNRLYGHFRAQGYEGLITKDLNGAYMLSSRDPTWLKRKPAITLDLVLLAAVFAVTEKTNVGMFGSYVIGARSPEGSFVDVGDVAGLDKLRDGQIQAEIMREGLITGRRIERKSASGVRPGMDLVPHIVVTVRFEGLIRDPVSGDLKLRNPKVVALRPDKRAAEADSIKALEAAYLRDRMG
jgi:DNA ligase 1